MKAGVIGIGAAVPHDVITNAHFAARLDTSDEWIVKRTGIHERHWLNGAQTLADLAVDACAAALGDAGCSAEEVDHVLVASITPDRLTPGLGPEIAARLGAPEAGGVDMNAACAGFLYALDHAAALIESGRARCIVVCGAEALSRIIDPDDRSTAVLFGDGAGAVVLAAGDLERGVTPFELHSDGVNADLLYAGRDERMLRMHGREVYRHAVKRMADATEAALRRSGLGPEDVDLFVAHQANARIVQAAATAVGLPPERVVLNVDRMANTSSASIPLALWQAEQDGRLRPGATVALAAFGAGFVWAAGVIGWKERALVCA